MRRSARKIRLGILLADLVWMLPACFIALMLSEGAVVLRRYPTSQHIRDLPLLLAAMVVWTAIYIRMHLDGFRRGWGWGKVSSELFVGSAILTLIVTAAAYPFFAILPRLPLLYFFVALPVGFFGIRVIALGVVASSRAYPRKRVVIIGTGPVAQHICEGLQRHAEMAAEVVGFLYPPECEPQLQLGSRAMEQGVPATGVIDFLREKHVTDVIAVLSGNPAPQRMLDMLARIRSCGIHASVVPYSYELFLSKPALEHIDGLPLLSFDAAEPGMAVKIAKRLVDLTVVAALAVPAALAILLAALVLTQRKNRWLRREIRCGERGIRFTMFRLNVRRKADESRFERLLDMTGIAELPQLWNVLRGEMSMVGPRPESPDRVKHYSEWQQQRLRVKPGITGLAQVHGLREESSSQAKAQFDLEYLVCWNPFFDLVLIVQTVCTVMTRICKTFFGKNGQYAGSAFLHVDRAQSSAD